MIDRDDLPPDPDLDAVPSDLRLIAGLGDGRATVLSEDGVSQDLLVLVPAIWRHAQHLEGDDAA